MWVKAQAYGRPLTIFWEAGEISGTPRDLVDEFRMFCKSMDGERVQLTMTNIFTTKDHLSSPFSVLILLQDFAGPESPITLSDDWPTVDLSSEPGARV